MRQIHYFSIDSPVHKVTLESRGFSIKPRSDAGSDLSSFQRIAQEAAQYVGNYYGPQPHKSDGLCDSVFFAKLY
jgi:hypothetical protein